MEALQPKAGNIEVKENKLTVNAHLQTMNKQVFVCGDVAGDLQFSHAAEFHARILLNNFFSPLKKKLNNAHMFWVTFTDPERILALTANLSIDAIFNKIYPHPTGSGVNQHLIIKLKEKGLTETLKKLLQNAYKLFS